MQVFRYFFSIVRRNVGLVVLYAGIFLGMTIIITKVQPQATSVDFEQSKMGVTVVDRDQSDASKALEEYLYSRQDPRPLQDDRETIQDALYRRETNFVLYIPAGYQQSLFDGSFTGFEVAQLNHSYQTVYVGGQLEAYAGAVKAYLKADFTLNEALANAPQNALRQASVRMNARTVSRLPDVYYYFTFLCYGLGMVMIFALSPVLMAMGKREITARMNVSALSLRRKNAEMTLGAFVLALVCFVAFIGIAALLYRQDLFTAGGGLCILNAFAYLVFSTSLALLIGQVSRHSNMVSALSNLTVLGMCFLGGIFVPYELLGSGMKTVAKFIPTHWYERGIQAAARYQPGSGHGLQPVWQGIGMQLLFAAALFSVTLVLTKRKQQVE